MIAEDGTAVEAWHTHLAKALFTRRKAGNGEGYTRNRESKYQSNGRFWL
jgi:hypothetical protein